MIIRGHLIETKQAEARALMEESTVASVVAVAALQEELIALNEFQMQDREEAEVARVYCDPAVHEDSSVSSSLQPHDPAQIRAYAEWYYTYYLPYMTAMKRNSQMASA
jgi:hypothetical protein